eukprot:scaffold2390_cov280-Prasinococcus_capsulatus_cf.AAC.7
MELAAAALLAAALVAGLVVWMLGAQRAPASRCTAKLFPQARRDVRRPPRARLRALRAVVVLAAHALALRRVSRADAGHATLQAAARRPGSVPAPLPRWLVRQTTTRSAMTRSSCPQAACDGIAAAGLCCGGSISRSPGRPPSLGWRSRVLWPRRCQVLPVQRQRGVQRAGAQVRGAGPHGGRLPRDGATRRRRQGDVRRRMAARRVAPRTKRAARAPVRCGRRRRLRWHPLLVRRHPQGGTARDLASARAPRCAAVACLRSHARARLAATARQLTRRGGLADWRAGRPGVRLARRSRGRERRRRRPRAHVAAVGRRRRRRERAAGGGLGLLRPGGRRGARAHPGRAGERPRRPALRAHPHDRLLAPRAGVSAAPLAGGVAAGRARPAHDAHQHPAAGAGLERPSARARKSP